MERHQALGLGAGAAILGPIAGLSAMSGNYFGLAASAIVAAGAAIVLRMPLVTGGLKGDGGLSNLDPRPTPLLDHDGPVSAWDGIPFGFNKRGETQTAVIQHMLIAGAQGSGKSVMLNNLLAYLSRAEDVKLAIINGKGGLDLNAWSGSAYHNDRSTDPGKLLNFLNQAIRDMLDRYNKLLKLGLEEIEPGCGLPFHCIVIDEFANYTEGPVKKVNDAIKQAIAQLVMQGRQAGVFMILATQHPSVSAVPSQIRNNLPQRFCFRVENAQASNMVLGTGAASKGFDASQINMLTERGVGLAAVDGRPIQRFRAFWIDKEHKAELARVSEILRGAVNDSLPTATAESGSSDATLPGPDAETRDLIEDIQSVWCDADRLHNSVILERLRASYGAYASWSPQMFGRKLRDVGLSRFKIQFTEEDRVNHWGLPKAALFAHNEPLKSSQEDRKEREDAAYAVLDAEGRRAYEARLLEISQARECVYCHCELGPLADAGMPTVDHRTPLNKGGGNEPWNLLPACKSCNSSKRDMDVYEWLDRKKGDL